MREPGDDDAGLPLPGRRSRIRADPRDGNQVLAAKQQRPGVALPGRNALLLEEVGQQLSRPARARAQPLAAVAPDRLLR